VTPELLQSLAAHAADVAVIDGDARIVSVTMGELADGSRRHFALVITQDDAGLEQTFRVSSPAIALSPAWAKAHKGWTIEVCQGESWLMLTDDDDYDAPTCSCGDDFDPACALHGTLEVER